MAAFVFPMVGGLRSLRSLGLAEVNHVVSRRPGLHHCRYRRQLVTREIVLIIPESGCNVLMSQKAGDRPNVYSVFQAVNGECVAEPMRVHVRHSRFRLQVAQSGLMESRSPLFAVLL